MLTEPDDPVDTMIDHLTLALDCARVKRLDFVAYLIRIVLLEIAQIEVRAVRH